MTRSESILKYAIENAIKFEGRANPGAVIGKILAEDPDLKDKMKDVAKEVNKIVQQVNKMGLERQKKALLELNPKYFEKEKEKRQQRREERKELPPLKNAVEGKVVTRIAPEPSKYNHLGHAISFLLNYMYAKKYSGKCILRFEDTNPEKSATEYVDAMLADVIDYLDIHPDQTVYVSDHIPKYYELAEKLIDQGNAYTCRCKSEDISGHRKRMINCPCRKKDPATIKKEWESMKKGAFKEGEITLRIMIAMDHKNAVMRDPVIFRLDYHEHYRQGKKFKVWPMYDFENAVEESLLGVTHILRSNEFESRIELQDYIRGLFGLPNPVVRQYARFNVTGAVTQGREIRALIESGRFIGWDDPRLVTLRALKRRGIIKEAFYELAKVIGMSKSTSNLDFSVIASINRHLLDATASRFFFIEDPVKVTIEGAPSRDIILDLHPHHMKGGRKFRVDDKFYISKKDMKVIKDGEFVRLMECLNFVKKGKRLVFDSTDVETYRQKGTKIIHWLPQSEVVKAQILLPDCKWVEGIAEKNIVGLAVGSTIQFERYAFCRLDSYDAKEKAYKFWYAHK